MTPSPISQLPSSGGAPGAAVLVTGAAGFIASRTAELLLEAGQRVVGVDNLNDYYDVRLKHHRLAQLRRHPGFTFVEMDIGDADAVDRLFTDHAFSAVVNLAARAGVRYSMENPRVYLDTNAMGTLNLLEGMKARGVKKMVLASTSSLYAGQPTPFVESLPVNTPISPYAASKKAAEVMAYTYHHLYGFDVSVLRYFTVYGPAGRPDMSPFRFIKWIDEGSPIQLFGDGRQSRDFTYVDDIARGTIAALRPLGYEIINLGGGNRPVTLLEMIRAFEERLGKTAQIQHLPFHKADMLETSACIDKAAKLLDWRPEVDPFDGFARTVDWYLANRDWLRDVKL
jgi:nucleoside-diphosphate-sugar epimerase